MFSVKNITDQATNQSPRADAPTEEQVLLFLWKPSNDRSIVLSVNNLFALLEDTARAPAAAMDSGAFFNRLLFSRSRRSQLIQQPIARDHGVILNTVFRYLDFFTKIDKVIKYFNLMTKISKERIIGDII